MKKLRKRRINRTFLIVVSLLVVMMMVILIMVERGMSLSTVPDPRNAEPTSSISGEYVGQVELKGIYSGALATPVATPTIMEDLGRIDLALNLTQDNSTIVGYVSLEHTLVYTQVRSITATPTSTPLPRTPLPSPQQIGLGPAVRGTFDGTTLRLDSDPFEQEVAGRRVTRMFTLVTSEIQKGGDILVGIYRETISGYSARPATVIGPFTISRPSFQDMPQLTPTSSVTPTGTVSVTPSATSTGTASVTPSATSTSQPSNDGRVYFPLVRR